MPASNRSSLACGPGGCEGEARPTYGRAELLPPACVLPQGQVGRLPPRSERERDMGTMWLPPRPPETNPVPLENVSSVVIVGANGSGKSRLGAWIDTLTGEGMVVHRVSAQRALTISEYIQPRALEQATRMLLIGSESPVHRYEQKM